MRTILIAYILFMTFIVLSDESLNRTLFSVLAAEYKMSGAAACVQAAKCGPLYYFTSWPLDSFDCYYVSATKSVFSCECFRSFVHFVITDIVISVILLFAAIFSPILIIF